MDLRRWRQAGPALGAVAAMLVSVAWVRGLRGSLVGIQGSTEAWLLAHVQRVHWFDDFGQAVVASRIPNTYSNALYPWLVAQLSHDVDSSMVVGHVLAAASLGLMAAALWGIWRPAVGSHAAVGAAAACLLPAVVSTACQARYDSPALALVLLTVWASSVAWRSDRSLAWPAAGALVALTYVTREYLGVLALAALGVACLAHVVTRRRLQGPVVALAQVALVTTAASFVMGLDPLEGLRTIGAYADQDIDSRPMLAEILGPWGRRLLTLAGAAGWVSAALRAPDRRALWVPAALMAPFLVFPFFPQQSPQYYVLGAVLLGSGVGGLALWIPSARARVAVGAALALALAGWSTWAVPRALAAPGAVTNLHVESSGRSDADLLPMLDWAGELSQGQVLVLSSHWVENIDAYAELHLGRPVGFVYRTQLHQLPEMTPAAGGRSIVLVVVEEDTHTFQPVPGRLIDTFSAGPLVAQAHLLDPGPSHGPDLCAGRYAMRGFCTQRDWLEGGTETMRTRGAALRALWGPMLSF